jgi:hypothetical protein
LWCYTIDLVKQYRPLVAFVAVMLKRARTLDGAKRRSVRLL